MQEGGHLCADSYPTPWGRKLAHGHYAGVGHRSQHGLGSVGAEIQEVKRKLMKTIRENAVLEARLRGDPELPLEYDSDEPIEYLPESPPRKRIHYGEPGYRTRYL
jgi:hypothetical protein